MPSEETIASVGKYNKELMKTGVLDDLGGLKPTSRSARVRFSNGKHIVLDGPFAETKERVAGYWIIEVKSKEDPIASAKRVPQGEGGAGRIEIREFFEIEDFAPSKAMERRKNS